MNQTWDLSVLYKDFDDPAYAADMAALDAAIAALHKLAEEAGTLSASELTHRYADAGDAFVALESKLYIYASLRYSADTGNTAAASTVGRVMDKTSAAVADDTRIREAIAAIGHDRQAGGIAFRRSYAQRICVPVPEHSEGQPLPPERPGGSPDRQNESLRRRCVGESAEQPDQFGKGSLPWADHYAV